MSIELPPCRDPPESSNEVGFKVKVKGRQRFRVLSSRTQIDGTRGEIQYTTGNL